MQNAQWTAKENKLLEQFPREYILYFKLYVFLVESKMFMGPLEKYFNLDLMSANANIMTRYI